MISEVDAYIEEKGGGNKYLTFASTEKIKNC